MKGGAHVTPRRSSRVAARAEEREQDTTGIPSEAAKASAGPDDGQDAAVVEAQTSSQPEAQEELKEEEPGLDAFEEETRSAVDAFQAAAADPATFLRPSTEVSELARKAAKVHVWPTQNTQSSTRRSCW